MRASRVVAALALAGVSLIAAVVSYLHSLAVVRAVGARPPVAYLIPFLADLVILGASAALLEASSRNRHGDPGSAGSRRLPALAVLSLAAGVGVTAVMNVAAGWRHGLGGSLVAGWPAAAFILALESLAGIARRGRGGDSDGSGPPAPATPSQCQPPDLRVALAGLAETYSQRSLAVALDVPRSRIAKLVATPAGVAEMAAQNGGPE